MKSEKEIADMVLNSIGSVINSLPAKEEKSEALTFIMITAYNLLRTVEDDKFVRGWLESALHDVKTTAPAVALTTSH